MSLLHMKIIKNENKRKNRLMLNIEKYKKEVIARLDTCQMERMIHDITGFNYCGSARDHCTPCAEYVYKWLLSEYKESVLNDAEREYLSAVIKPFREKIEYIRKNKSAYKDKQFISIGFYDDDYMYFPFFENDAMYKCMELGRKYTLEELGL